MMVNPSLTIKTRQFQASRNRAGTQYMSALFWMQQGNAALWPIPGRWKAGVTDRKYSTCGCCAILASLLLSVYPA